MSILPSDSQVKVIPKVKAKAKTRPRFKGISLSLSKKESNAGTPDASPQKGVRSAHQSQIKVVPMKTLPEVSEDNSASAASATGSSGHMVLYGGSEEREPSGFERLCALLRAESGDRPTLTSYVLGRGRFGQVVALKDNESEVVKSVSLYMGFDPLIEEVQRHQELRTLPAASLRHCCVARTMWQADGKLHFLFPRAASSVANVLKHDPALVQDRFIQLASHMAKALMGLGTLGLLHSDLKLQNILWTEKQAGTVFQLADFGSCRKLSELPADTGVLGTQVFSAPEALLSSRPFHANTDIFSLGFALWIAADPSVQSTLPKDVFDLISTRGGIEHEEKIAFSKTLDVFCAGARFKVNAALLGQLKTGLSSCLDLRPERRINAQTLFDLSTAIEVADKQARRNERIKREALRRRRRQAWGQRFDSSNVAIVKEKGEQPHLIYRDMKGRMVRYVSPPSSPSKRNPRHSATLGADVTNSPERRIHGLSKRRSRSSATLGVDVTSSPEKRAARPASRKLEEME